VKWRKLGPVFAPDGTYNWAVSHAFCPTAIMLGEDRIRVLVSIRDRDQVGRVGYADVDAADPTKVLAVSEKPVFDIGEAGMFDDNGVTPGCVIEDGDSLRLYYGGWQLGHRVRYFLFQGLAVSHDGGDSFERVSRVPILDRSDPEPMNRVGGHVLPLGDRWRMWYAGGDRWVTANGKRVPSYPLRYLESDDGVTWGKEGELCLRLEDNELGFSRPFVVDAGDRLRLWYSIRQLDGLYRVGYAESDDGRVWERMDSEAGLDVSESGWDSEMVGLTCYQETPHGTYLFYNGNNFGETGFGVAVLEEE
jgi:predicted GH43/DUF377 family glycosyl hydrolase